MFRRFAVYVLDRRTDKRVEGEMLFNLQNIARIYIDEITRETKIETRTGAGVYTFTSPIEYKFLAAELEAI